MILSIVGGFGFGVWGGLLLCGGVGCGFVGGLASCGFGFGLVCAWFLWLL